MYAFTNYIFLFTDVLTYSIRINLTSNCTSAPMQATQRLVVSRHTGTTVLNKPTDQYEFWHILESTPKEMVYGSTASCCLFYPHVQHLPSLPTISV